MPKIRTIDKGYDEYKETIDPGTSVSRHDWRQIVITGQLSEMVDFLKNPYNDEETEKTESTSYGKLRRVSG